MSSLNVKFFLSGELNKTKELTVGMDVEHGILPRYAVTLQKRLLVLMGQLRKIITTLLSNNAASASLGLL